MSKKDACKGPKHSGQKQKRHRMHPILLVNQLYKPTLLKNRTCHMSTLIVVFFWPFPVSYTVYKKIKHYIKKKTNVLFIGDLCEPVLPTKCSISAFAQRRSGMLYILISKGIGTDVSIGCTNCRQNVAIDFNRTQLEVQIDCIFYVAFLWEYVL